MSQPIAIVGASARAAAWSAQRAGFTPIAADLFADADLRQLCPATRVENYPEDLLSWLGQQRPAGWMFTGALENHADLIDAMANACPLWGNRGYVLRSVRSPGQLAAALGDAGLLFPETRRTAAGLPRDGSWLAKTYRGASGSGVRVLDERQGDKETMGQGELRSISTSPCLPISLSPSLVYQQRIAGETCCAVYVAHGRTASLLGVTRQLTGEAWLGAREFQYCGSIGLHRFGPDATHGRMLETLDEVGSVLAQRFELAGLFGVDFVVDRDRAWTIEVNPRYTASVEIVERATGIATLALHAAACQGRGLETAPVSTARHCTHGKAILFAKQDLSISAEFAAWALEQALAKPWPKLADVPVAGTAIERGQPILTLFAEGATAEEVELRLRDRVVELENRLYTP